MAVLGAKPRALYCEVELLVLHSLAPLPAVLHVFTVGLPRIQIVSLHVCNEYHSVSTPPVLPAYIKRRQLDGSAQYLLPRFRSTFFK